jgi:formylglycine-generating enzyme required for sulfatase activity
MIKGMVLLQTQSSPTSKKRSVLREFGLPDKNKNGAKDEGKFMMGTPQSREPNEAQVAVQITRSFWMSKTECTQPQWETVMHRTLRDQARRDEAKGVGGEDEDQPIYLVNHYEAVDFCKRLAEMVPIPSGWKFALPTEAQWEYACRAGTQRSYHYGEELNMRNANCDVMARIGPKPVDGKGANRFQGGLGKTSIVGRYVANAWGLQDMHGNVWEWMQKKHPHRREEYRGHHSNTLSGT